MSQAPRVDYQTDPSQYRHWKLKFEGPVATLAADFDFAINEQCFTYDECAALAPFTRAGKSVLQIEYGAVATLRPARVPRGRRARALQRASGGRPPRGRVPPVQRRPRRALGPVPEVGPSGRNERQASQGAVATTGCRPVETRQRSGATPIVLSATGDFGDRP